MREQVIKIKNQGISYKIYGENHLPCAKKSIFLILHGWAGSSDSWKKVCENLENNFLIYALDFPGFGKSEKLKEAWRVDDYVELVEGFIDSLLLKNSDFESIIHKSHAGQLSIIAHSFGGRVALKLAAKNPTWLNKLFLCDAAGIKHPATLKQQTINKIVKAGKSILPSSLINPAKESQNQTNFISLCRKYLYKTIGAHDYYQCPDDITRKTFQNIIAEDLLPCLEKIKTPTVIIWGEKDKYTPLNDGILMQKEISGSKLHIIKDVGHGIHLFAPEKICAIIKDDLIKNP